MENDRDIMILEADEALDFLEFKRRAKISRQRVEATTDDEMVSLWLGHFRSDSTREAYAHDIRMFRAFIARDFRSLRLRDLLDYSDDLANRDLAPATIRRRLASLRSLVGFAHRLGYLAFDIGAPLQLPELKDTLFERIMTEDQIAKLLDAVRHRPRDLALLRLIYGAGLRVSEAIGLKWIDMTPVPDGKGGQITVFGKGGKTRHVRIPRELWNCVQRLRGEARRDEPVFRARRTRGHLCNHAVRVIVKKAALRANLDPHISTHWLRHAHVSHALDAGAPVHVVRQTVGHASLETTSKYSHAKADESSATYITYR